MLCVFTPFRKNCMIGISIRFTLINLFLPLRFLLRKTRFKAVNIIVKATLANFRIFHRFKHALLFCLLGVAMAPAVVSMRNNRTAREEASFCFVKSHKIRSLPCCCNTLNHIKMTINRFQIGPVSIKQAVNSTNFQVSTMNHK